MRLNNKTIAWLVGLTLFTLLLGCSSEPATETEVPHRKVSVELVKIGSYAEHFMVSGKVEHSREALLSFRAGGFIKSFTVDDGDRFEAGQLLAALDTTEIAAAFVDATEQREKAERDVRRMEHLYSEQAISLQNLQDAKTGLERALAGERRARFVLNNTIIHAPFSGFVAMRMGNTGEMVGEGAPVLRVVEDGASRMVRVGVPGRLLPWLHVGDTAEVIVETMDEAVTGTITRIGAVAERGTGNFLVEFELPSSEFLREGLVAKVELLGPLTTAIALPGGALAEGDEDRGVFFIVEDGRALRRELTIERISGDSIYVLPDLPEGTAVITAGAGFLTDGEPVDVVNATEMQL
jgi:membrane fusion protein, multidrug efflux system